MIRAVLYVGLQCTRNGRHYRAPTSRVWECVSMCHARMIDQQTLATDMPDHIHKTDTSERIKEARHMLPRKHTKSHPIYRTSVYRSSSEAVSTSWSLRICACSTPCYISPSGVSRTQARRWTRHMRTFPCTSFHFPLNKKKRGARSQRRHLESHREKSDV